MRRINPKTKFDPDTNTITVQEKSCNRKCAQSGEEKEECESFVDIGGIKYCNDPCYE
jgi:hypothetical protein